MELLGELFKRGDLATPNLPSPLGLLSPAWSRNGAPEVGQPSCLSCLVWRGMPRAEDEGGSLGPWQCHGVPLRSWTPDLQTTLTRNINSAIWLIPRSLGFLFCAADPTPVWHMSQKTVCFAKAFTQLLERQGAVNYESMWFTHNFPDICTIYVRQIRHTYSRWLSSLTWYSWLVSPESWRSSHPCGEDSESSRRGPGRWNRVKPNRLGSDAALSLPSCVTPVKLLNLAVPQFPQLQNGNSSYLKGWRCMLNELTPEHA